MTAIHHYRIRQIQSEIHHRLLSANAVGPPQQWYESMHVRLQEWLDSKPPSEGFCSAAWANVNYHSTMVLLHRPSPANPSPDVADLRQALASAGKVMRAYKAMHRAGQINFGELNVCVVVLIVRLACNVLPLHGWHHVSQFAMAGPAMRLDYHQFIC